MVPCLTEYTWVANISAEDINKLIPTNSFWKEVWQAWAKFNYIPDVDKCKGQKEFLWCNSHIRVDGKPVMNKHALKNGLMYVHQLVTVDGTCKSHADVCNEFHLRDCLNWLEYRSIVQAIPIQWWGKDIEENASTLLDQVLETPKCSVVLSKVCYVTWDTSILTDYYVKYWFNVDPHSTMQEYIKNFARLYKITSITKLRNFQYRLLLHKIFTNDTLFKWGIVSSPECPECGQLQTLKHLLWECYKSEMIWYHVEKLCPRLNLCYKQIFSNVLDSLPLKAIETQIVLVTKYFLFRQKCMGGKVSKQLLDADIMYYKKMALYMEGNTSTYQATWSTIKLPGDSSVGEDEENAPAI